MYSSAAAEEIFQRTPPFSKPSQFKLKSWTETIEGYQNEAKKLTICILKNRKLMHRPYSWFVTVYVWKVMSPKEITSLWTRACRSLRQQGIVALWVREPTRKNKVHYHLLVSSQISSSDLATAIEKAMPPRKGIGWHKQVKSNDDRIWLAYYITKAKIQGKFRSKVVADKYASKRLLFKPGLNMKKYGTIGSFWLRPKQSFWQEVQEKEKRIGEGLSDWRVRRLAQHAFELLDGYISLREIERSFGLSANEPAIRLWIERIFSGDPQDHDDNARQHGVKRPKSIK